MNYNFLNLPSEVKIDASNTVTYYYDAMGSKVRQSTIESGGNPVDRFYFNGFEYGNSKTLEIAHNEEGDTK